MPREQTQAAVRRSRPVVPSPKRTWEDRVAVRWPALHRRAARRLWRVFEALPAGHPVRLAAGRRLVSRSYGAFNRHDIDALLALYHPRCRWDWSEFEGWPEEPVYEGPEGLRRGFLAFREAWGEFRVEPLELRDCGWAQLLTCRMHASGAGSGVGLQTTWWQVAAVRDGLIALVANYSDRDRALEAVRERTEAA